MNSEEHDIKLMEYLMGELSGEEKQKVEEWIYASEENTSYYNELCVSFISWRWFFREARIRHSAKRGFMRSNGKRKWLTMVSGIAASVLLLWALSVVLKNREDLPVTPPESQMSQIMPGSYKAQLILSHGERMLIGENNVFVQENDTLQVAMVDEGTITYLDTIPMFDAETIHTLMVDRGGEYRVILSDSSIIWVNSATELSYPITFSGRERRVRLMNGEAYFKINANPSSPFIVEVGELTVEVTGTEFNINTHWDNQVETVLVNGVLSLKMNGEETTLKPEQRAVYDIDRQLLTVENVETDGYISWKNGEFMFTDESLGRIMEKLALWYDYDYHFEAESLKEIRLSGNLQRYDRIDGLLRFIEAGSEAKFLIEGKKVTVLLK